MTGARARPTTSVALATYEGEAFLGAQLASIAAQSVPPDELVIGDDGSRDGSADIVRRFAREAGLVVRFERNPERLGAAANFAALLARCTGDVIFLSDQDDVWDPQRIETSLACLAERPDVGLVFSDARLISSAGAPLAGTLWSRIFFDARQQRQFQGRRGWEVLLKTNVVTGATLALRRAALAEALPIPRGWVHDAWLAFWITLRHGALPLATPLISYRVHAAQQIGVPGWSPARMLALVRRHGPDYHRAEAANFRALAERLQPLPEHADAHAAVLAKAEFLERLAAGREDLAAFVRGTGTSLARRSFGRYGLGLKQVAFELVGALDAALRRARGADER